MHKLSNHPVHIFDNQENLSPSAFIPFCGYGGDMEAMGVKIDQFDVPVCNSFQAKILNNQLCYEVDLYKIFTKDIIKKGVKIGLIILIDHNEDRQVYIEHKEPERKPKNFLTDLVTISDEPTSMIYVNTIGKYTIVLAYNMKYLESGGMRINLIYAINIVSEPLKLYGEGYYNLNDIKVQNHKNILPTLMIC